MVRKFFELIEREIHGIHEAAYLLGAFAILSQLFALIRDRLFAHFFGAGATLDVYYAAFRIPDLIFVLASSLVSIYVLIPFLAEKSNLSFSEEKRFVNNTFSAFAIIISLVSIAAFFAAPMIVRLVFPGFFPSPQFGEVVLLTKILLLQPILLGLSSLLGSIIQMRKKFILYSLSPLLYNVGIIVGILFFYENLGIAGLAWGVVLGALLHLFIQIPLILRMGLIPSFTFFLDVSEIKRVLFLSLPRTIALSSQHLLLLFLTALASFMVEGTITVFNFAFNLQAVPLSIIAVSYSVAAFPTLARLYSNGERVLFLEHVMVAARHIIFWSLPVFVLFIVLRAHIVRVVLGSGAFDWTDTRLTAATLALFVVSLLSQGLVLLFTRGYYAAGNTRTPLLINVGGALFGGIAAFSLVLLFSTSEFFRFFVESLFHLEDTPGTSVLMLALGYSLGSVFAAVMFPYFFQRDFSARLFGLLRTSFESLSAAVIAGFVAYELRALLDNVFDINTLFGIFSQGLLSGVGGIIAGVVVLRILGSRELAEVRASLHQKFWKASTITPEEPEA